MSIYIDLLLLAAIVVYIVDLSGFKDTLLNAASRFTAKHNLPRVKSLRPFTCALCSVWWATLIYAACTGDLSLPIITYCAALSFFSNTLSQFLLFIREGTLLLIRKLWESID